LELELITKLVGNISSVWPRSISEERVYQKLDNWSFSPAGLLGRVVKGWIWLLISGVIGTAAGMAFSFFIPPRYEAAASFAVNITYGVTEEMELVVEDRVLDRVWQLAISDDTLEETQTLLELTSGQNPAWEDIEALRDHTRLDARLSRWELVGIDSDPSVAMEIANAWREITLDKLDQALEHAWNANSIQGVAFDVACVALLSEEEARLIWTCVNTGPDVAPEDLEFFRQELEASRGILPMINYEAVQSASVPTSPVLWPRGLLAVIGGVIGLIAGAIVLLRVTPNSTHEE
jgi:capsular polysaccharide biosynthesis protein